MKSIILFVMIVISPSLLFAGDNIRNKSNMSYFKTIEEIKNWGKKRWSGGYIEKNLRVGRVKVYVIIPDLAFGVYASKIIVFVYDDTVDVWRIALKTETISTGISVKVYNDQLIFSTLDNESLIVIKEEFLKKFIFNDGRDHL